MSEIKREYYENGQIQSETPYQNGQKCGIQKWWDKDGRLWFETSYRNNQRHGIHKIWGIKGQLERETHWLYNNRVTEKEYRKHILVEGLACLK